MYRLWRRVGGDDFLTSQRLVATLLPRMTLELGEATTAAPPTLIERAVLTTAVAAAPASVTASTDEAGVVDDANRFKDAVPDWVEDNFGEHGKERQDQVRECWGEGWVWAVGLRARAKARVLMKTRGCTFGF